MGGIIRKGVPKHTRQTYHVAIGSGDGEVDITEFDITESDVTFFQEIDITESDVTKKGN